MLDVGFKNFIDESRINIIIKPNTSMAKWLIKEAIEGKRLINCTHGKKACSLILLNTSHIILSALKKSSIKKKLKKMNGDYNE